MNDEIKTIEKNTVYRLQAMCDDGSAFFTSTNGMPTTLFTKKQIKDLAQLRKPK